ncbi:UDP-N-acetylmuramoyl-tripeptide--D-alanyl-D-alanine ligase [Actomonas aquatica]|uniref:UDP-N-acetylmuramoyl-tripeptide--D-alanyl-D-alanine ligase n=1 Tax=Actomonas aquatica TaxID=2866162 RepID=A0ABZ1CCR8_9BACT|nr:UDP-N-acetylmuramoyl-tripeptide--D-alanyl-D-alanine ligase [Opitutus sp. WL0086]WRQ89107.1 UDP-N-acetylmuramoyl-tripeptide--D-alanyl-D-alanine ligase [Opitutus sp. WL0086]
MPRFAPAQLADWTHGSWTVAPEGALTGFAIDSRRVKPGEMFVALRTDLRDGHDFLGAAAEAGAGAALVKQANPNLGLPQLVVKNPLEAFQTIAREHRRAFRGPVAGISGSAGKTSTKDLLARLLGERALATEGNLNNHLGVPLTLTRLDSEKHGFAIIEAGISAPGEMAPLARMIEPDVAVITMVDHAHTRDLGGIDGVAREKAVLPAAVRPDGVAVLPADVARRDAFRHLPVRRLTVERADVIRPETTGDDRVFYTVTQRAEETAVTVAQSAADARPETYVFRRTSEGMTQNAVLAICVARWLGVSANTIRERLHGWGPAPLRGEVRREQGRLLYVDCYNANPASMADALRTFDDLTVNDDARLLVLGGMEELGEECAQKHEELGRNLRLKAGDQVLVIGTGSAEVRAGALASGARETQIEILTDLTGVAERVAAWRGPVFVKGSRRYRLETIMNGSVASVSTH